MLVALVAYRKTFVQFNVLDMAAMLPAEHFPHLLRTISEHAWMADGQEFEFMLRVMARGFLASAKRD